MKVIFALVVFYMSLWALALLGIAKLTAAIGKLPCRCSAELVSNPREVGAQ